MTHDILSDPRKSHASYIIFIRIYRIFLLTLGTCLNLRTFRQADEMHRNYVRVKNESLIYMQYNKISYESIWPSQSISLSRFLFNRFYRTTDNVVYLYDRTRSWFKFIYIHIILFENLDTTEKILY